MSFFKIFIDSITKQDIVIYITMAVLFFGAFFKRKKGIMFANFIAALGMIGTFLGICIGLSNFDENNITKSIPVLLQGMRTAFFTSLVGMSLSIILKFILGFAKEKVEADTTEDAILEQTEKITELNENIKEMTSALKGISDIIFKDSLRTKEHDTAILELTGNLKHLELVKEALKDIDSHIGDINSSIGDNIEKQSELSTRTNELLLDLFNSSEKIKEEVSENKKLSEQIIENSSKNTEMIVTRITENSTQNTEKVAASNAEILKAVENSSEKTENRASELIEKLREFSEEATVNNKENTSAIITELTENNVKNTEKITESNTEILKAVENSSEKAQESSSELVAEFRDFAKTMAENNNKAFIQALNESMKDLNTRLTEQFGENFKELNKAVFKLVEWQEHYKNTVIETTENQKVIFEGITKAKDDLAQFVNKGEQVSQIADDLQQTIDITKEKQAEFNTELQVLSEINKSAKELMPTFARVNNAMDENLNTFKNSLDEISLNINEVTNNTVNEFQKTYSEFSDNMSKSTDKFNSLMSENAISFEKTSTETLGGIQKAYSELSNAMILSQNEFNEVLKENNVSFKENVNKMSTDAVSEVQRVYTEFSNNIGQSTEQFNTLMSENAINFEKTSTEALGGIQKAYSELSNVIISSKDEFDKILTESSLVFKENNEKIVSSTNEQVINTISQLDELSRKLVEESNIKTQGYLENINSLFEKAIDNVKQMNINLEKEGTEITTKTSQSIEQLNAQVNENLKTSVENIKNGLEAALNASLTSLGDELAILSNKFVKDYTPLTEQLRDIVSISKGARR